MASIRRALGSGFDPEVGIWEISRKPVLDYETKLRNE
jgi:hypothetical protein